MFGPTPLQTSPDRLETLRYRSLDDVHAVFNDVCSTLACRQLIASSVRGCSARVRAFSGKLHMLLHR